MGNHYAEENEYEMANYDDTEYPNNYGEDEQVEAFLNEDEDNNNEEQLIEYGPPVIQMEFEEEEAEYEDENEMMNEYEQYEEEYNEEEEVYDEYDQYEGDEYYEEEYDKNDIAIDNTEYDDQQPQYEEYIEEVKDEHIEENQCVVCIVNRRTHAAVPCGHYNLCQSCSERVTQTTR